MPMPFTVLFGSIAHITVRRRSSGSSTLTVRNSGVEVEITHWGKHQIGVLRDTTTGYCTVYTELPIPDHPLVMATLRDADAHKMAEALLMPLTGGYQPRPVKEV